MASFPRPHSPYFLVRVLKQIEKESKSKIGSIIIPDHLTFMQFNTQCGEIVDIGEGAAKYFPQAKVGQLMLFHHFVQAETKEDAKVNHLIHEDKDFHYYVVTAYEYAGKGNECYGVLDGDRIIPNKDYVFLEAEKPPVNDLPPDEAINQALKKTNSGLFLFDKWKESREDKEAKQNELKSQVESLAKSGTQKRHINQAITEKQWEMEALSKDMNIQTYLPYTVSYANDELSTWFDRPITCGAILGMLNFACGTTLNFNNRQYIVSKVKFIAYLYNSKKVA